MKILWKVLLLLCMAALVAVTVLAYAAVSLAPVSVAVHPVVALCILFSAGWAVGWLVKVVRTRWFTGATGRGPAKK